MTFFTQNAEIVLPEVEESLIDAQYIHWGYVNSCQRIVKGRKSKRDKWNTYWLELCGSTIRFYRDTSLHVESFLFPPPSTFIVAENETKVAFFELENAEVLIVSDEKFSQMSKKSKKQAICPQVYRRHLFELKLRNIRSTYTFQAPSRSAMLRWVSKIQESLDAIKDNETSVLENLAQDMIEKKSKAQRKLVIEEADGDDDSVSFFGDITDSNNLNPKLINLKKELALKKEQIWQFEAQLIEFYGRGKGNFIRDEFICTTNQDYFMIPGRIETFIPAGTNVTIFGQLPNRRWRCVVELNDLVKAIGLLIKDLKDGNLPESEGENVISARRNIDVLNNLLNNLPDYPLLGCLPTSILNMKKNETITDNEEDAQEPLTNRNTYNVTVLSSPYKPTTPQIASTGNIHETLDNSDVSSYIGSETSSTSSIHIDRDEIIVIEDLKISDLDSLTPQHSESESASEGEDEHLHIIENVKLRNFGSGIIIRNKLRQKGISIMVGSSSSEDEDEDEGN